MAQFSLAKLADVERDLMPGDLLLCRRPGSLIARAGRSEYSHAAIAGLWGFDWMTLETREWVGGRAVLLREVIRAYPAGVDVRSPKGVSNQQRLAIVAAMRQITGKPYGWGAILSAAVRHALILRWCFPPETDDTINGHLPMCSMAASAAYRIGAGFDPVPHLSDRWTEPGDLGRSAAFTDRFRLVL